MGKKESNIPKGGIPGKPNYPNAKPPVSNTSLLTLNNFELIEIFNEWNKRYSENSGNFLPLLDKEGKPIKDYGESCALYFQELYNELY